MQYPAAGAIAQFTFAHTIKEELQKPERARHRGEKIVGSQGSGPVGIVAPGLVPKIQDDTPLKMLASTPSIPIMEVLITKTKSFLPQPEILED